MTGQPWLAVLDDDDRAQFFLEMDAAEASGSTEPLGTCLRAWRVTAGTLADPDTRAALTGPRNDDDYVEVPRP